MAQRRMLSIEIVESDQFLDLPPMAQLLYIHLCMHADDEGFVSSVKRICWSINASDEAYSALVQHGLVIPFPSGVAVIVHWKIHNKIREDRLHPTYYAKERELLTLTPDSLYALRQNVQEQAGDHPAAQETAAKVAGKMSVKMSDKMADKLTDKYAAYNAAQVRLGQDSPGQSNSGKPSAGGVAEEAFHPPSVQDVTEYALGVGVPMDQVECFAADFVNYYTGNGWHIGQTPMRDWRATVRSWKSRKFANTVIPENWGDAL